MGKWGTEEWNLQTGTNLEDQGCHGPLPEQQNVKAVSIWHCAATTTPHICCPNCYAEQQSHKENVALLLGNMQKSRTLSLAQHYLPALDLFWASFFVRVQPTSVLLISPGLFLEHSGGHMLFICKCTLTNAFHWVRGLYNCHFWISCHMGSPMPSISSEDLFQFLEGGCCYAVSNLVFYTQSTIMVIAARCLSWLKTVPTELHRA